MMATSAHIMIIGASHAGLSCAERLRTGGFEGQITVLERDPGLPLQRPPLSKTYLKADLTDGEGLLPCARRIGLIISKSPSGRLVRWPLFIPFINSSA